VNYFTPLTYFEVFLVERQTYYNQFGWTKSPFIKTTSLETPTLSRPDEYAQVSECVGGWDRIMVVTAPIGYGKTSFMNYIIKHKPENVDYAVFFDSYEPPQNVMRRIQAALPFWRRLGSKNVDRSAFGEYLGKKLGSKRMLLLFDEAQDYEEDLFKWLRTLNDRAENVFMVFFGLASLENKITAESSFRDRKTKSIALKPFSVEQLMEIVRKRIVWCGGKDAAPFSEDGLKRLAESANSVPRLLMENGQRVVEEAARVEKTEVGAVDVEEWLGAVIEEVSPAPQAAQIEEETAASAPVEAATAPEYGVPHGGFTRELSPTQKDIVGLLLENESLSIAELSQALGKDIRSMGSLIRKLRGLDQKEVARKPNVPYPLVVQREKQQRLGRMQYTYALSDNARRLLSTS